MNVDFGSLIDQLFADPATSTAIYGIVLLAFLDFATGTLRSIADKTFAWSALDVWVRGKVAGRVIPLVLLLIAGQAAPDLTVLGLSVNILGATAMAGAATFAAAEVASIIENVNRNVENPVPNDNLAEPQAASAARRRRS